MKMAKYLFTLVMGLSLGCSGADPRAADVGQARLELSEIPAGVGCLRVTAAGTRAVQRDFQVTPGQSSILNLKALPVGQVDFTGEAFDGACPPPANSSASWVSDPASALLGPGLNPTVVLVMHRNARATVNVDFEGEPACVSDGANCTNNAACCSGSCVATIDGPGVCGPSGVVCAPPTTSCPDSSGNPACVDLSSDAANCGACGNTCTHACTNGQCVTTRVLVAGAASNADWNNDVQAKLIGSGAFSTVDTLDIRGVTPSLGQLQAYDSVLVYSDNTPLDSNALGDNLANYFDAGGSVVVATFANASIPLGGRWASGNYQLIAPTGQEQPSEFGPLQFVDPASPLLFGVTSLTASAAFRSTGGPINGGVTVATWGSGAPLIVRGFKNGRALVSLNMFPPSSAVRSDFWLGSGAEILTNALLFH